MPPQKKAKPKSSPPPELPEDVLKKAMSIMGRKGGSVKGPQKARTSEQARAAVNKRWEKHKKDESGHSS